MKKGQITLFIIIGLVVLIGVALIISLRTGVFDTGAEIDEGTQISLKKSLVEDYVNDCLDEVVPPGIYLLARQGGFIYSLEDALIAENETVAYHAEIEQKITPTREFMESELSTFVSNSLMLCVSEIEDFRGLQLEFGLVNTESQINAKNVFVDIDFPLTITQGRKRITVDDFNGVYPVRLGDMLDVADELVDLVIEDQLNLESLAQYDYDVNILPYDKNNIVYSLTDTVEVIDEVPLTLSFASKITGNNAPELEFVPDFVLAPGNTLEYQLNASDVDGDDLSFEGSLDVSITGLVTFTASETGVFDREVCVKDTFMAEDCKDVRIVVG